MISLLLAFALLADSPPPGPQSAPAVVGKVNIRAFGAVAGTGIDQSAQIQAALNQGGTVIVPAGTWSIGKSLRVGSNTTIEFLVGAQLVALPGIGAEIIINAHPTSGTIIDSNISIVGPGFIDGNRRGGASGGPDPLHNSAGQFVRAIGMYGVDRLLIDSPKVYDACTYAVHGANLTNSRINGVTVAIAGLSTGSNQDGVHLNGPIINTFVTDTSGTSGDDLVALNFDDGHLPNSTVNAGVYGPYVGNGPGQNVTVDGVHAQNAFSVLRLLSAVSRVDQVSVRNLTGTFQVRGIVMDCDPDELSRYGTGNFGSISFDDIDIKPDPSSVGSIYQYFVIGGRADLVQIRGMRVNLPPLAMPILQSIQAANVDVLDVSGFIVRDGLAAPAIPIDLGAGNFGSVRITDAKWSRPGQTTPTSTPFIAVRSNPAPCTPYVPPGLSPTPGTVVVGSLSLDHVSADQATNVVGFTAGSLGSIQAVGLKHTNAGAGNGSFALAAAASRFRAAGSDTALLISGTPPTSKKTDGTEDQ